MSTVNYNATSVKKIYLGQNNFPNVFACSITTKAVYELRVISESFEGF